MSREKCGEFAVRADVPLVERAEWCCGQLQRQLEQTIGVAVLDVG
jgi:hypothetical protein